MLFKFCFVLSLFAFGLLVGLLCLFMNVLCLCFVCCGLVAYLVVCLCISWLFRVAAILCVCYIVCFVLVALLCCLHRVASCLFVV